MFRFSLIIILILSFSFSHQFENSYQGAIPSFSKTPDEGKFSINELYEIQEATKVYGANGNTSTIEKWKSTNTQFSLDYFGLNGAGIYMSYHKKDLDSPSENADFEETDFGVYYLWNNIKDGLDLHNLTFNLTRIKTGIYNRTNQWEIAGVEAPRSSAQFARISIDFIISNKIIWSNLIDTNIKDDDDASQEYIKSRLIYDINEKMSASAEFMKTQLRINSIETYENVLKVFFAYQLSDKKLGNLDFNLKISPYFTHSLSGKNYFKTETMGVEFNTYFK